MSTNLTLESCCTDMGLSGPCKKRLCDLTNELRDFERMGKERIHTPRERIDRLEELEGLALAMRAAIERLDSSAFLLLDLRLNGLSPERVPDAKGYEGQLLGKSVYMQRMACNLAFASRMARYSIEEQDGRMGRKSVLGEYAGFIACIAAAVKDDNIKPGRGGDFERLCGAIFSDAGVHAKPEGAIRYFLKHWRDDYRERGYCL